MTAVLVTRGKRPTGKMPCEDGGRDWGEDAAIDQEMLEIVGNRQKLGEGPGTDPPPEPPEGDNLAIPCFQTSGFQSCAKINVSCFKPSFSKFVILLQQP